jgi:hypothetical protein
MLKYKDHSIFKQGIEKRLCFLHLKTYMTHIETNVTYKKQPSKVTSILKNLFSTYFSNVKFEN